MLHISTLAAKPVRSCDSAFRDTNDVVQRPSCITKRLEAISVTSQNAPTIEKLEPFMATQSLTNSITILS